MDSGSTGLVILLAATGVLVWLGVAVVRGSLLRTRMDPSVRTGTRAPMPAEGTSAVVSKTLRPVGVIDVGSEPYEAISEGEFIEPGTEVVVMGHIGQRVLVRRKR
ncbi:MAG TPA: NfeD family protein [Bacillota bacterium]|nr:MAG: hypothetical protein BWY00_00010 [Firmicutes bacterium ADurb.Bin153]HNV35233.1 NfeD family protein [Bacillota bacterium]HPU95976.1 NfeD family protein [Bacillota bacterium]